MNHVAKESLATAALLCRRYVRKTLLDAQTEECRMCTVSDLIESHALDCIDLLKVDVEGAELDVLRGIAPEHWGQIHQVTPIPLHCFPPTPLAHR